MKEKPKNQEGKKCSMLADLKMKEESARIRRIYMREPEAEPIPKKTKD